MKLAEFQDAFVDALYQRPHPGLEALSAQPAFAVYRNTVIKGCVDALCDNFPAVQRLVGEAWMRAAAAHFAEQHPPQDARLVHYGAGFADFLDSLPATRELPYLSPVARLEWLWLEAFTAPLEPALTLAGLAGHDPAGLDALCLRPRAGARWCWFDEQPIHTLWHCSREGLPLPEPLPWHGEGALLVASPEGVHSQVLGPGGCTFLNACAAGLPLGEAAAQALAREPALDFTELLGRLMALGTFSPLD